MEILRSVDSANKPRRPTPPRLLCDCPGCRQHVARLEELNAALSREVDKLRREADARRAA